MKRGASLVTWTCIRKFLDRYLLLITPLISKFPIFSFIEGLIVYFGKENLMKIGRGSCFTEIGVNSITTGKLYSFVWLIY
jgi:hypothetical protein